ncbi:hypothetical protein [Aureliella helgolandensis]|uniref:Uncharacterized protein n=1 Tax=Aureliella helgolandensis TaxID=2527968 RepID=A0A518GB80_9BACT|nr:hypothetical protein [Aureliella helgolandensis]QDV25858.1 hypothetical protein Q31a_41860 [Aureliella helgolandensis]
MKYSVAAIALVCCFGFFAAALAQDAVYFKTQGEVMESSPPKFMLISDVDLEAKTLTGMSTIERHDPKSVVSTFHITLKFSDIKVTNAMRVAVDDDDLSKLKGKLVVLYDGKEPLSGAYMGLFREDTFVISVVPAKK